MKKLLCAVLILCLVPMISLAEIDLSGLSTEELMDLNKAVIMEIFSRDDFQLVTVPAGTYKVGEDIPAGTYTVQADNLAAVSVMDKKGNYTAKIYTVTKESPSWFWRTAKAWPLSTVFVFRPTQGLVSNANKRVGL